jgi:hypothetical protein
MTELNELERREVALHAKLCGARRTDILVLDDGSRWRLTGGLRVVPALE